MDGSSSEPRTSRKRKRDGTEVPSSSAKTSAPTGAIHTVILLLCAVIAQIHALANDPEKIQGSAVEHLKSAWRTSSEDAARILGSSLYLINHLLQETKGASRERSPSAFESRKRLDNTAYNSCVLAVIELWNTRSLARQDLHDVESNVRIM